MYWKKITKYCLTLLAYSQCIRSVDCRHTHAVAIPHRISIYYNYKNFVIATVLMGVSNAIRDAGIFGSSKFANKSKEKTFPLSQGESSLKL